MARVKEIVVTLTARVNLGNNPKTGGSRYESLDFHAERRVELDELDDPREEQERAEADLDRAMARRIWRSITVRTGKRPDEAEVARQYGITHVYAGEKK